MTNDKNGKKAKEEIVGNPADAPGKVDEVEVNIAEEKGRLEPQNMNSSGNL